MLVRYNDSGSHYSLRNNGGISHTMWSSSWPGRYISASKAKGSGDPVNATLARIGFRKLLKVINSNTDRRASWGCALQFAPPILRPILRNTTRCQRLQDNSPTNQLAVSQVADCITRGLVNSLTTNFKKTWLTILCLYIKPNPNPNSNPIEY